MVNIANSSGDFKCQSWNELKDLLSKSAINSFDDVWISGEKEYPCLAILINGNDACIHYFLDDEGNMWQSVGYGREDIAFFSNGERCDMPADSVVSLDIAMECAKQFIETLDKPRCIEWREL